MWLGAWWGWAILDNPRFADLDDSLSDAAHGCSSGGEWCSGDERLRGKQKEVPVELRGTESPLLLVGSDTGQWADKVSRQWWCVGTEARCGDHSGWQQEDAEEGKEGSWRVEDCMSGQVEREWKRKNKIKMEDANADTLIA